MVAVDDESPAGLAVHRVERPGAPRVVFIHGSMDRSATFAKAARRLDDLSTVRYDRRGYGRSRHAGVHETIAGHVDDLDRVVGDEPSVLVGHSLGGVLALALAARRPEVVLAVGAFEAPMPWRPWWPTESAGARALRAAAGEGSRDDPGDAAAEAFMRRIVGDEVWERLPPSTRRARRAEGRALVAEIRALRVEGAPYDPAEVRVPVVAGRGTASEDQLRRAASVLSQEVAGAELVEIQGATHRAPSTHPAEFAAYVRRVVARAGTG